MEYNTSKELYGITERVTADTARHLEAASSTTNQEEAAAHLEAAKSLIRHLNVTACSLQKVFEPEE